MELKGEKALDYLNNREMKLGGYEQKLTTFHPINPNKPSFPVLVYIANENSTSWLGPAEPEVIAEQVLHSEGPSGHNVEYVMRLAMWVHQALPSVVDEHLFAIEESLLQKIYEKGLKLEDFMDVDKDYTIEFRELTDRGVTTNVLSRVLKDYAVQCERRSLKCVKL